MKQFLLFTSLLFCSLFTQAQDSIQFIFHHQLDAPALQNAQELDKFRATLPSSDSFALKEYSIFSYCDSTASTAYNQQLAQERMEFIQNLIQLETPLKTAEARGENYSNFTYEDGQLADYRITVVTVYYQSIPRDFILEEPQPMVEQEPELPVVIENHFDHINEVQFEALEVGDYVVFPGLLFEGGRAVLLPESQLLLDSIAEEFIVHEHLEFIIEGHICCHPNDGTDGENFDTGQPTLSLDRAKSIYLALKMRGVDPDRMQFTGMMASKPLGYEPYRDRRVEFKITRL